MTINPYSNSAIRDSVLQQAQTQLQGAHADVKTRNDHVHAAKQDLATGDVEGAQQEQQAAQAAQQNVLADRSALNDFRQNVGNLRGDISQRREDFQTFKSDLQSGDLAGAKAAFQAAHQDEKSVVSDVQGLGLSGQPPATPINVTA